MRLVVLKFIQGTENRNTGKMITQLELVDDSVTIKIEATETVEYFSVVLFQCTLFIHCMLCKVVLSFESEWIKHLKNVAYLFKRKLLSSTFLWCCLLRCTRLF